MFNRVDRRSSQRLNEIYGVLLLCLTAVLLLSLVSYDEYDTGMWTSSPNEIARNLGGRVGAMLSEWLILPLGASTFLIPLFSAWWALRTFVGRKRGVWVQKVAGLTLMILSTGSLLTLHTVAFIEARYKSGGIVGLYVTERLHEWFGQFGTEVVVGTVLIISVLLTTEFLFISFFKKIWRVMHMGFRGMVAFVQYVERKLADGRSVPRVGRPRRADTAVEPPDAADDTADSADSRKPERTEGDVAAVSSAAASGKAYRKPSMTLLREREAAKDHEGRRRDLKAGAEVLEKAMAEFDVEASVVDVCRGPTITRYEVRPAPGVKVVRVLSLADDLALALKASRVRIEAPVPGKGVIGIEIPNERKEEVLLRDVLSSGDFRSSASRLALALGKTIGGDTLVADLAEMPHLLIAGATGTGKTVCLNGIICSILFKTTPDEVKFMLVDPKMVELAPYNDIPHLIVPVITEARKAAPSLQWLVQEMDRRYRLLAATGVRNIEALNRKMEAGLVATTADSQTETDEPGGERLPYIVVVIDELADLMMVSPVEMEDAICRLAQLARSVGIHLILATQRPSVDVLTGVIKANFPARISFQVSSKVDSRTVLDRNGAEKLIGRGDMLYLPAGASKPVRAQGAFVSDEEIKELTDFLRAQGQPEYVERFRHVQTETDPAEEDWREDELFDDAVRIVLSTDQASISMVQRRLRVGYARAARLIDMMELAGIVGPPQGSQAREILVGKDYLGQQEE